MGDLSGSFSVTVRVMTKHAEKTRVGLWGQSAILKAVWDVTVAFQRCLKKINQNVRNCKFVPSKRIFTSQIPFSNFIGMVKTS